MTWLRDKKKLASRSDSNHGSSVLCVDTMFTRVLLLAFAVAAATAVRVQMSDESEDVNPEELTGDDLVEYINSLDTTWTVNPSGITLFSAVKMSCSSFLLLSFFVSRPQLSASHTVYAQISAAALISFGGLWVRRLLECGAYFFQAKLITCRYTSS